MKRPTGYTLLGCFIALGIFAQLADFGVRDRAGPSALWEALLIALSAVFAEALWNCRPWVARAATAWTAMRVAGVIIRAANGRAETLLDPGVRATLLLPLAVYGVMLAYVCQRARRLGAPRVGLAATVPRPVP